ncbi:type II toxin-antitoxin system HipA family toxin [Duganella sp. FT135W]|uniref:Type II toxin-antitoxin system HipA family toxin n=1 Tax=Duganella flavida TaxID=2692175 RepID=A0A6L8K3R5_9BURK|nr:HipA domain-containing protein [Duganella flavida]MYM22159.1 type II toxin-antitoxin system HipA family toxin [Duganella flavida]
MTAESCIVFDCSHPDASIPIGHFEIDMHGDGRFGYGSQYLQTSHAFSLDPIHVPLQTPEIVVPRRGDGTYGIFSDAGPNAWGAQLTIKLLRESNSRAPQNLVEWFLSSSHHGSGCLGFSTDPSTPPQLNDDIQSSRALSGKALQEVEAYTDNPAMRIDAETAHLLSPGRSLGGARPKTVVMHDGTEHIAKFSRLNDLFDVPAAEYATLRLATKAGINVPSFELINIGKRSVLLIDRFDRVEGSRIHYASAHSFLDPKPLSPHGREYVTSFSYAGIAEVLRLYGADARTDAHELYRRMVFNIMVGNVDDHLRNHAFLLHQHGQYRLSPAFDIVPHIDAANRPQSIGVGEFGPASTIVNALSQCGRFLLTQSEALEIISELKDVTSTWRDEFRYAGMARCDINALASCFTIADAVERQQVQASISLLAAKR